MAATWNPNKDLPDLTGKIFVVTGTSAGGVGREIVKHLALGGAKRVYCTARSSVRSDTTIDGILKEFPKIKQGQLVPLMVDFESPESVQDAVAELKQKETQIDVLINNAGGLGMSREISEAGWEKQIATNYFGHFIFVNGLMPLLRTAAASGSDVRIINVGSNAVRILLGPSYRPDFSDRELYRGVHPPRSLAMRTMFALAFASDVTRYGLSKLALMMFSAELQRRFDAEGLPITSVSVDPGPANSHNTAPAVLKPSLRPLLKWTTITPEKASYNALYFATAKEATEEKNRGKYFEPVAVATAAHPYLEDVKERKALWDATTDEINTYLRSRGRSELESW